MDLLEELGNVVQNSKNGYWTMKWGTSHFVVNAYFQGSPQPEERPLPAPRGRKHREASRSGAS